MAEEKEAAARLIGDAADVEMLRMGWFLNRSPNDWKNILGATITWQLLAGVLIILSFPVGLYLGQSFVMICIDAIVFVVLVWCAISFGLIGDKKEE